MKQFIASVYYWEYNFSVIFPEKLNRSNFCDTYGLDGLVAKPTVPNAVAGFRDTPDNLLAWK